MHGTGLQVQESSYSGTKVGTVSLCEHPFLLVLRQSTSLKALRLKMASDRAKWSNYVPGTQLHIGYSR